MTWLSPAFPVGAFGYSHGLETAIREGWIDDAATLTAWIAGLVEHGSGWTDAVLFCAAWRADAAQLSEIAELAAALAPSLERSRETLGQGAAFLTAVRAWNPPPLAGEIAYPVAVGALAGAHDIPEDAVAAGYLETFTANLISAAVRLVPLGQTAGLRVLAALPHRRRRR